MSFDADLTLRQEGRHRVVDVGAGPGLDVAGLHADGFDVVGVDLTPANVAAMRQRGLTGLAGSLYQLPLCTTAFDALWSMSTFVHVPRERRDVALTEMLRVVAPGTGFKNSFEHMFAFAVTTW